MLKKDVLVTTEEYKVYGFQLTVWKGIIFFEDLNITTFGPFCKD